MRPKPNRMISRAAMTLLMMVLTATTAWAELDPVTVDDYTFATGSDDDGEYYVVNSEDAFEKLAAYVSGGGATSGKRFKLTSDIEGVTTMVGTSGHPFKGTFDGGGNTLTVNYTTDAEFCGPFCYTYGATIKNLRTAGTINTSSTYAGGVVGRNGKPISKGIYINNGRKIVIQ